jgi:hypothetical protein
MRILLASLVFAATVGVAAAAEDTAMGNGTSPQAAPQSQGDSEHSTGRSSSPATEGIAQPQGPTGPLDTKSGGAPAESPQGQSPPGMQAAPAGSDKTIVDQKK